MQMDLVSTASMNAHIPAPSRTAVFPMTSAPKGWWADYYRRNPTLLMRLARRLKAAL